MIQLNTKDYYKNIFWEKMSDQPKTDPPSYFEATGIQGFDANNYNTNWNTNYGQGHNGSGPTGREEFENQGSLVVKSEPTSYSDSSTSSKTSFDNQSDSNSISSYSMNITDSSGIISDPSASNSSSSSSSNTSSSNSSISTSSIYLCSCICPCCSCNCCWDTVIKINKVFDLAY